MLKALNQVPKARDVGMLGCECCVCFGCWSAAQSHHSFNICCAGRHASIQLNARYRSLFPGGASSFLERGFQSHASETNSFQCPLKSENILSTRVYFPPPHNAKLHWSATHRVICRSTFALVLWPCSVPSFYFALPASNFHHLLWRLQHPFEKKNYRGLNILQRTYPTSVLSSAGKEHVFLFICVMNCRKNRGRIFLSRFTEYVHHLSNGTLNTCAKNFKPCATMTSFQGFYRRTFPM